MASSSNIDLNTYEVETLKNILKNKGLSTKGSKDELIYRINKSIPKHSIHRAIATLKNKESLAAKSSAIKSFVKPSAKSSAKSPTTTSTNTTASSSVGHHQLPKYLLDVIDIIQRGDVIYDRDTKKHIFSALRNGYPFISLNISIKGMSIFDFDEGQRKYPEKSKVSEINNLIIGIKTTTTLKEITFVDNYRDIHQLYNDDVLENLGNALKTNKSIEKITLSYGFPTLQPLSRHVKSATLNDGNVMFDIRYLLQNLKQAVVLEELVISPEIIGHEHFKEFLDSLLGLHRLKKLRMGTSSIFHNHQTIVQTLNFINEMPHLDEVYMGSSMGNLKYTLAPLVQGPGILSEKSASSIAHFLKNNNSLSTLGISGFVMSKHSYDILLEGLMDNFSIKSFGYSNIEDGLPHNNLIKRNRLFARSLLAAVLEEL